jgi:radical SAM-linked protein
MGVERPYLLEERRLAYNYEQRPDCRQGVCQGCGVCQQAEIKPRLVEESRRAFTPDPAPDKAESGPGRAYRLLVSKTGPARFMGHLEFINQLTIAIRRCGLALAHSQGFHPHPLIRAASALPLGVESLGEEVEIVLQQSVPLPQMAALINRTLPQGLTVLTARPARPGEEMREPAQLEYLISTGAKLDPACLERFQSAATVVYQRQSPKGLKTIDLKTALACLELKNDGLRMVLKTSGPRPKASEVLEAVFGLEANQALAARVVKQISA